jgi:hypothetical protein
VSTFANRDGQALTQDIILQFAGQTKTEMAGVVMLLIIPGMDHRGRRLYSPGALNLVQGADVNAQDVVVAASLLSNNNQLNVRALTYGHEDIDEIIRFVGLRSRKSCR